MPTETQKAIADEILAATEWMLACPMGNADAMFETFQNWTDRMLEHDEALSDAHAAQQEQEDEEGWEGDRSETAFWERVLARLP